MKKRLNLLFYYFLVILFLEVCYKILMFKQINIGFFFTTLFSLNISLLIYFLSMLFKKRKSKYIYTFTVTFILSGLFSLNYIYYRLFSVPFSFSSLSLATGATTFYEIGISAFLKNIVYVLIMFIPVIMLKIFKRKIDLLNIRKHNKIKNLSIFIVVYSLTFISIYFENGNVHKYYFDNDNIIESINYYGFLTAERLSTTRYLLGFEEKLINIDNTIVISDEIESTKNYKPNKQNIDFEKLSNNTSSETEKNLYNYLENSIYTMQNDFTGYYQGKNLIFILAEGFNSMAVSEKLTPTLYKLTHTGFTFNNYYSPVYLSTTGGEFQAMTGLIPTQDILSLWKKNSPSINYAIGNSFKKIGYTANAYHDWTYTYYKRNITMPTLGFDNYMGCNNGLEKVMDCSWLPSDVDLINTTYSTYMNEEKFVTYYISVSGHAPYNFNGGNSISSKNKELVENLPYSDTVKAYLSSQIEFDRAVEELINKLKETNKLDDTVIVITGDHYPYTFTNGEVNELSTYYRDDIFEVNHSNLIIWNNNNEVIKEVDKVASQIDVLPTLLNLFGIEYDSRLIVGHDILSNAEGLAIFSNHSWISDKGRYNSNNKSFVSNNGVNIDEEYVNNMNSRVDNSFSVSKMIIETDAYKKVLGD